MTDPHPPPSPPPPDHTGAGFAAFAVLLALGTLAYHAAQRLTVAPDIQTVSVAFAILTLLRPRVGPFLLLVAAQTAAIYARMPWQNTNRTLLLLVGVTILTAALTRAVARRRPLPDAAGLYAAFGPLLRLEVCVVYALTGFHKLNGDFFRPETSCATELYGQLVDALPVLPLPSVGVAALPVAAGTVLVELALPVLLLVPRTRMTGVGLGFLLHVGLGLAGHYDFSITLIALLALFLPTATWSDLERRWRRWARPSWTAARRVFVTCGLLAIPVHAFVTAPEDMGIVSGWNEAWLQVARETGWWVFVAGTPGLLVVWLVGRRRAPLAPGALVRPPHVVLLALPAVVLLNGLCPYLGLKTETAFARYSNLRTEQGRCNHWLVPSPPYLATYQTDLVRIVGSANRQLDAYARRGDPMPFLQLCQMVAALRVDGVHGVPLRYLHDGVLYETDALEADGRLTAPMSFVERKFFRFRVIPGDRPNSCEH